MRRNAFDTEFEDRNFEISFNLNPQRWIDNCPDCNNPILCEDNWQSEIKYLNSTNDGISETDLKKMRVKYASIFGIDTEEEAMNQINNLSLNAEN